MSTDRGELVFVLMCLAHYVLSTVDRSDFTEVVTAKEAEPATNKHNWEPFRERKSRLYRIGVYNQARTKPV